MADSDLVCNFRKCRKRLTTFAWLSVFGKFVKVKDTDSEEFCANGVYRLVSNIFCDEDGTKEFNKAYKCPACENNLSGKFDIIRVDLQPSEEYKSMVLAGLRPEVVMEVCSRAIAFWTYQAHNERVYHEYVSTRAKESKTQLEKYYEQILGQIQNELNNVKSDLSVKTKELVDAKKRLSEVTEKQADKCRQLQRLQAMYDSLRRKTINPAMLSDSYANNEQYNAMKSSFTLPIGASTNVTKHLSNELDLNHRPISSMSPHREFHFTPVPMIDNNDNGNPDRSKAITNRFSIELNTPRGGAK